MRHYPFSIRLIGLMMVSVLTFCKKKDKQEEPQPQPVTETTTQTKLVRFEKISTQTDSNLRLVTNFLPDLKPLSAEVKYTVDVYNLVYKTTFQNREIQASGLVCVPKMNAQATIPTISFQHGTMFNDADVPSGNASQQILVAALASTGYMAVAPDFIGFGTSVKEVHPYYVAAYSASTVRDMLVAAQELTTALQVNLSGKLFLAGYSQGGNVTVAAARSIEASPIRGFALTASAAGAGGYRLKGIFNTLFAKTDYASPAYLVNVIEAFRNVYNWPNPASYYYTESYTPKIAGLLDKTKSAGEINNALTNRLDSLLQPSFVQKIKNGTETTFINALAENSLDNWKPTKPLKFYHGTDDEIVPFSDSDNTFQHMHALGSVSVSFVPLPGKMHGSGALPMLVDVLQWFKTSFPD